jgi:hypothetical protein
MSDVLTSAVERSFDRFAAKIELASSIQPPDNRTRQEIDVKTATRKTAESESARGSQNQTQADAGDYGTHSEQVGKQKSETRGAAPEGTDEGGSRNDTARFDDKNYTLNGPAKLASDAAGAAIAALVSSGRTAQAVSLINGLNPKQAAEAAAPSAASAGGSGGPGTGQAGADIGAAVGGKPDSVSAAEDEAGAADQAETAPTETPGSAGSPVDSMVAGEIQRKLNELAETDKVTKEVMTQLKDVLQGIGMGASAAKRYVEKEASRAIALAKIKRAGSVKKAGPGADRKANEKVVPKNMPPSTMQDDGEEKYNLQDGDPDESYRGQANQTAQTDDKTNNGAEHHDAGDYKLGSKTDWSLYDRVGKVARKPVKAKRKSAGLDDGFMRPQIVNEKFFRIEDQHGDSRLVPADAYGTAEKAAQEEGVDVENVTEESGWFAQLSAPGYLDQTDWEGPFGSEEEARAHLEEMYGDDMESDSDDDMDVDTEPKEARKTARTTVNGRPVRTKRAADGRGPDDQAAKAGGDEEVRYDSADKGDTDEDEIADGNTDTLAGPESSRAADQAQSQLDREHAAQTRGNTVASTVPAHTRRLVEQRLASFDEAGKQLLTVAKAAGQRQLKSKSTLIASANDALGWYQSTRKALVASMQGRDKKAARQFSDIVESLPTVTKSLTLASRMLAGFVQHENASVAKFARFAPAIKLAVTELELNQTAPAELGNKIAEYIRLDQNALDAIKRKVEAVGDVSQSSRHMSVRTARRLPSMVTAAPLDLMPQDELAGIFDE